MTEPVMVLLAKVSEKPSEADIKLCSVEPDWRSMAKLIESEYIKRVSTPIPGIFMYVDEEGMVHGKLINKFASWHLYPGYIYGDVMFVAENIDDGSREIIDINDWSVMLILHRASGWLS